MSKLASSIVPAASIGSSTFRYRLFAYAVVRDSPRTAKFNLRDSHLLVRHDEQEIRVLLGGRDGPGEDQRQGEADDGDACSSEHTKNGQAIESQGGYRR